MLQELFFEVRYNACFFLSKYFQLPNSTENNLEMSLSTRPEIIFYIYLIDLKISEIKKVSDVFKSKLSAACSP